MWKTVDILLVTLIIKFNISLMNMSASKRPFYNIAHMVNSIREVDYYVGQGANAIETDITFSNNGSALYAYHGYPCDCLRHCTEREDFGRFLGYIRDITTPGMPSVK